MRQKGVYKRGNKWWICFADLSGKIIRKSTGTDSFREAETQLIGEKKAVREGKLSDIVKIRNHTFFELRDAYLPWMRGRHRSADSKAYRITQLAAHFGDLPLRRFGTAIVEQYQSKLLKDGLKPSSCNKNVSLLKAMFAKAEEWAMVEEETLKRVRRVKLLKEAAGRLRFLSVEEMQSLVSVCDEHLRPIVVTALHTGMRRGELLGLRWEQIDLQHGFITLTETKNGEGRQIPIDQTLRETINRLPRRFVEKDGKRELLPYVFHDAKTLKPYASVKHSFTSALKRSGISDFHFHDLRHTFASQLAMAGVDLATIKELLGHKTIAMTLRYAHLAPAHRTKAVSILDSVLSAAPAAEANFTITAQETKKESAGVS